MKWKNKCDTRVSTFIKVKCCDKNNKTTKIKTKQQHYFRSG